MKQDVELTSRPMIVGNVNLILADGATLTAPYGIRLSRGNQLTVYGQTGGTGKLAVDGKKKKLSTGHAAIGAATSRSPPARSRSTAAM